MGQQRKNIIGTNPDDLIKQEEESKKASFDALEAQRIGKLKSKSSKKIVKDADATETISDSNDSLKKVESKDDGVATRPTKQGRARARSGKYVASKNKINNKVFELSEAIETVKLTSYAKFDATVELHIKLKTKKGDTPVRQMVALPGGLVKSKNIVILDDKVLAELDSGKVNFDLLVATPEQMPKIAKYARLLGPKGLMPSPKSGTVASDPNKAMAELTGDKIELRQDPHGNIHAPIAKVSWENSRIEKNFTAIFSTLPIPKVESITLCATMGPGISVKINK